MLIAKETKRRKKEAMTMANDDIETKIVKANELNLTKHLK